MRLLKCDRRDVEVAAEIECGWIKRLASDGSPKIELVSRAMTMKTAKEITPDMN